MPHPSSTFALLVLFALWSSTATFAQPPQCTLSTTRPDNFTVSVACTCNPARPFVAWTQSIDTASTPIDNCVFSCSQTFNGDRSCRARLKRPAKNLSRCCKDCFNGRYDRPSNTCVERKPCANRVTLQQIKYIRELRIPTLTTRCQCDKTRTLHTLFTNQANKRLRNCVRDCARPRLVPRTSCPVSYEPAIKACCQNTCLGKFKTADLVVPVLEGNLNITVGQCVPSSRDPSPSPSPQPQVGLTFIPSQPASFNSRVLRRTLRKIFREEIPEVAPDDVTLDTEDTVPLSEFKEEASAPTYAILESANSSQVINGTASSSRMSLWQFDGAEDDGSLGAMGLGVLSVRNIQCIANICGTKVTVWSKRDLRWFIINKAFDQLRKKPSFATVYTQDRSQITIRKRTATKYLVHVPFVKGYNNIF